MPPSTSRTPTVTATSATPSVAASSSTVPERNARRRVPIVAERYSSLDARDSLALGLAAVERPQRRKAANDVEEVAGEQGHRLPARARAVGRRATDQPEEDRDERQGQQHQPGRDGIERDDEAENRDRHHDGEDELRQVATEEGCERLDARDGGRRHLCALGSVHRGRAALQPCRHEVEAEL